MSRRARRASLLLLLAVAASLMHTRAVAEQPSAADDVAHPVFTPKAAANAKVEREATTKRVRYVGADLSAFPAPGRGQPRRLLKLDLFDDAKHTAVLTRTQEVSPGVVTWTGHLKDDPLSDANFVVSDGVLAGSVRMPGASYHIEWAGDDTYAVIDFDDSKLPRDEHVHPEAASAGSVDTGSPSDAPVAAQATGDPVIDLLIVYTDDARAAAGGTSQIESMLELAIANINVAYENSQVTQRLRLVHTQELAYNENGDSYRDLERVTGVSEGHLDGVHALRNSYGADLVSLITNTGDACGIAWVMTEPSVYFAPYGFNVTTRNCAVGGMTLAHELGHNMGLMHDRYVSPEDGAYAYSHGYVDPSLPRSWRTIMSYNDLCVASGTNCTRLQYFSNPNILRNGEPMGAPEGQQNAADAAKSLNNTASFVSRFRAAVEPCTDDAFEPNDSASAATPISAGQTRSAQVCPDGDDYFAVTASAGQTITLDLDHAHSAGDLDMVLHDSSGAAVAASTSNDDDEQVVYPVGASGTYHVRVYGTDGARNTYSLTLSVTEAATPADPVLRVSKRGRGTVRTTEAFPLIVCGADCTASYAPGSFVFLSAKPKRGYRFVRWSLGPCSSFRRGACILTMQESVEVRAVFRRV